MEIQPKKFSELENAGSPQENDLFLIDKKTGSSYESKIVEFKDIVSTTSALLSIQQISSTAYSAKGTADSISSQLPNLSLKSEVTVVDTKANDISTQLTSLAADEAKLKLSVESIQQAAADGDIVTRSDLSSSKLSASASRFGTIKLGYSDNYSQLNNVYIGVEADDNGLAYVNINIDSIAGKVASDVINNVNALSSDVSSISAEVRDISSVASRARTTANNAADKVDQIASAAYGDEYFRELYAGIADQEIISSRLDSLGFDSNNAVVQICCISSEETDYLWLLSSDIDGSITSAEVDNLTDIGIDVSDNLDSETGYKPYIGDRFQIKLEIVDRDDDDDEQPIYGWTIVEDSEYAAHVLGGDIRKLSTNVYELSNSISNLQISVENLDESVTVLQTSADSFDESIYSLNTSVGELQESAETFDIAIRDIELSIGQSYDDLTSLSSEVSALSGDVQSISSIVSTDIMTLQSEPKLEHSSLLLNAVMSQDNPDDVICLSSLASSSKPLVFRVIAKCKGESAILSVNSMEVEMLQGDAAARDVQNATELSIGTDGKPFQVSLLAYSNGYPTCPPSCCMDDEELEDASAYCNVSSIGSKAFSGCTRLAIVDFSDRAVQTIPVLESDDAFDSSIVESVIVPSQLEAEWKANESWSSWIEKINV